MAAVLDEPVVGTFDRHDFELAWQRDAALPRRSTVAPDASIVISRRSPDDFQDRQIYVWIDDEALGKIRYGQTISRSVEPGRHRVRVFNTLFTRTLECDVAPGAQVKLACGTGMPKAGWIMLVFLHVTYLRVWIEPESK